MPKRYLPFPYLLFQSTIKISRPQNCKHFGKVKFIVTLLFFSSYVIILEYYIEQSDYVALFA